MTQVDKKNNQERYLAVINPVELSSILLREIRDIETRNGCSVDILYSANDWHHLHLLSWSKEFPKAKIYVASERVFVQNPTLKDLGDRIKAVDRIKPIVPELADDFDIIPFLGCHQNTWLFAGDKKGSDRVEQAVFHKSTRTLFITDHLFAPSSKNGLPTPNKYGFLINDKGQTADGAQKILALEPKRLVFSHGKQDTFLIEDANDGNMEHSVVDKLKKAYSEYFL